MGFGNQLGSPPTTTPPGDGKLPWAEVSTAAYTWAEDQADVGEWTVSVPQGISPRQTCVLVRDEIDERCFNVRGLKDRDLKQDGKVWILSGTNCEDDVKEYVFVCLEDSGLAKELAEKYRDGLPPK